MNISAEELDNLFDNGFTMEDYEKAVPIKKLFMISKITTTVTNRFEHKEFVKTKCGSWLLIGSDTDNIWQDKSGFIYKGSFN